MKNLQNKVNLILFLFLSLFITSIFISCEDEEDDEPKWYCASGECKKYTYATGDYWSRSECERDCGNSSGGGSSGGGSTGGSTGGGSGTNCNYTRYTGSNTGCSQGYIAVTDRLCCPTNSPYYGKNTGQCYSSCSAALAAGNTLIVLGAGSNGGTSGGGTSGGNTGGGTSGGNTGGGTSNEIIVMFWLNRDRGHGLITVYVDNKYFGTVSKYYSSGTPSCGASGCATGKVSSGDHTYKIEAADGTYWTGTCSISSGCNKILLD